MAPETETEIVECWYTKVLLLRRLPTYITEYDVHGLVSEFVEPPAITKIHVQGSAGTAFVEFESSEVAHNVFSRMTSISILVLGQELEILPSRKDSVQTQGEKFSDFRILLITISRLNGPMSIALAKDLLGKYGNVKKIIVFSREDNLLHLLVEFSRCNEARKAMLALHGTNMYDGGNTFQIQPSRLQNLRIKENSEKSWDFSSTQDTNLTKIDLSEAFNASTVVEHPVCLKSPAYADRPHSCVLVGFNLIGDVYSAKNIFNLFSFYGVVEKIKVMASKTSCFVQFSSIGGSARARYSLQGAQIYSRNLLEATFSRVVDIAKVETLQVTRSKNLVSIPKHLEAEYFSSDLQRHPSDDQKFRKAQTRPTSILYATGIPNILSGEDLKSLIRNKAHTHATWCLEAKKLKGTRSCWIGFDCPTAATVVLMLMHNTPCDPDRSNLKMRFGFSKERIGEGTAF
eukprot:GHVP01014786.1.p1 GENE.GHVP01014786.1~~GHVP01014786.1.p1  ORF type:complete len:458 (-),score=74.19 GHVP01014786.1:500-1873(-)